MKMGELALSTKETQLNKHRNKSNQMIIWTLRVLPIRRGRPCMTTTQE